MIRRNFLFFAGLLIPAIVTTAEPLSKKTEIDFFRDVASRDLTGLATRSDGRLVAGPTLREIAATAPADLLWTLEPTPDPAKWLVGTGPDGRIIEVTMDYSQPSFSARTVTTLDDPQVFALKRLSDGSILAGTSPRGGLYLIRGDAPVARVSLPVDSIFDILSLDQQTVLLATGNPGRIYRVDLTKFSTAGLILDKITDAKILSDYGITVFGEIRDRNVRRLAAMPNGSIVAGSAPLGNVYSFPPEGGAPVILQENRDAEITDLLPQPDGELFAAIVFTSTTPETRITPPSGQTRPAEPAALQARFAGRSSVIRFPANGFPETLTARANTAFYRLARHADTLVIAGGEMGELVGYDLNARLSVTFAGSISSQVNHIAPIANAPGRFLVLRNNAPGLAVLDFNVDGPREAETRRIDLATPSQLGALRFNRLRNLNASNLQVEIRTSNASDEIEGWSAWTSLNADADGGWRAPDLRGRYVKIRLRAVDAGVAAATAAALNPRPPQTVQPNEKAPASAESRQVNLSALEIDRATLFGLPQNRRPQLQEFRVLSAGYAVIPAAEPVPPANVSLNQLLQPPREDDRRRTSFLNSQVVPSPGSQVVIWTVADPDGDNVLSTFSIRREDETDWIELVASSTDSFAQFDTQHLPDGIYHTRLQVIETAPRLEGERLSQTFETDDLIIDHTRPEILAAGARVNGGNLELTLHGRDSLSLLRGIEIVFNNGVRATLEQPADGVLDGREETFVFEISLARVSNASAAEVTLVDAAGNGRSQRLTW